MFSLLIELSAPDIEAQYNHVHHAHSLRFLERARLAFLDRIGIPNSELIGRGLFLVITEIEVRYKRELTGGSISVTCDRGLIEGKNIVLWQRILNERGKTAVEARVVSVFLSGETKRSVPPPPEFLERFQSYAADSELPQSAGSDKNKGF